MTQSACAAKRKKHEETYIYIDYDCVITTYGIECLSWEVEVGPEIIIVLPLLLAGCLVNHDLTLLIIVVLLFFVIVFVHFVIIVLLVVRVRRGSPEVAAREGHHLPGGRGGGRELVGLAAAKRVDVQLL